MNSFSLNMGVGSVIAAFLAVPLAMAGGATTYKYQVTMPAVFQEYLPCTGEVVTVEGPLHILLHAAVNGNRLNLQEQYNPMGLSGYGESSGDAYRATGAEHLFTTYAVEGYPVNLGRVVRYQFVGTGTAANFFLKQTQHLTVNANGEVTSSVDTFVLTCE